jgi:ribose transport system permease protein
MRVDLLTASTYTITGALAALGGVVLASQLLASDGSLGGDVALTSIAAVVLGGGSLVGGAGDVFGTVIGVLILGSLADGLTLARVSTFYQQIVTGFVLLFAVGFSQLRSAIAERR